jgi:hypothetical protein
MRKKDVTGKERKETQTDLIDPVNHEPEYYRSTFKSASPCFFSLPDSQPTSPHLITYQPTSPMRRDSPSKLTDLDTLLCPFPRSSQLGQERIFAFRIAGRYGENHLP